MKTKIIINHFSFEVCCLKPMPLLGFLLALNRNIDWEEKITSGELRVFSRFVSKHYILKVKDWLTVKKSDRFREPCVDKKIEIVHEDDCLFIVNKPAPLPVHPCGTHRENTLTKILAKKSYQVYGVNRIDSETSGLVFFVKKPEYGKAMAESLKVATKIYWVLVHGLFPQRLLVNMSLGKKKASKVYKRMGIAKDGKESKTYFRRWRYFPLKDMSLCFAFPYTGRTHQIRAHIRETEIKKIKDCAELEIRNALVKKKAKQEVQRWKEKNYGVVGDKIYGRDEAIFIEYLNNGNSPSLLKRTDGLQRQFLHAAYCRFTHPMTRKKVTVKAKLTDELYFFLNGLS